MRDYASLFKGLLADLGYSETAPDSHIFSDMDDQEAARVALATSFFKKLAPGGNSRLADAAALKKFKAINSSLPEAPWSFLAVNEAESCCYDYYKHFLAEALEPHEFEAQFDLEYIREHMWVGPGSAQKADSTYMVSKLFESTISYINPDLIRLYRAALVETGVWADAEMQRFQTFGFTKVQGGKIFFALKNSEISRTCCTEASLEMLIQKACCAFLEERLERYFGISLKYQPDLNRELARLGSVDGSNGTIDLVSASDCIGLQLFIRDFPRGVLKNTMLAARSSKAVLPDGSNAELRMVSTMGNAFTFPLQTLIFASLVKAVYVLMGIPLRRSDKSNNFGVFGDDIIVVKQAYDFTIRMLEGLGFTVNVQKSFNSGPFRESCGHDYIRGVNIRGVYIRSLETPQEVYSAINRLTRWSANHSVGLPRTLSTLISWIRDIRVPPSESDDAGIHVPFVASKPKLDNSYWFTYRCYKRRLTRLRLKEPDSDDPPINENGMAVGYLSGHIRRRDHVYTSTDMDPLTGFLDPSKSVWKTDQWVPQIALRDRIGVRARYQIAKRSIPWWDWLPDTKPVTFLPPGDYEWRCPLTRTSHKTWESLMVALLG